MREVMLIFHLIGLSMGLGTSFGFMFLGIRASKMDNEEATKFTVNTFALSKMGQIGLVLLVISGGYLITPFLSTLLMYPLLIVKLVLVAVLIVLIILIDIAAKKAKKGDLKNHLNKIQTLGKVSLLTALTILVLAVLTFH